MFYEKVCFPQFFTEDMELDPLWIGTMKEYKVAAAVYSQGQQKVEQLQEKLKYTIQKSRVYYDEAARVDNLHRLNIRYNEITHTEGEL